jgi:hypothetical protein
MLKCLNDVMQKVVLNKKKCIEIGNVINTLKFRQTFLERDFLKFDDTIENKMRLYFFSVAICHQTYSLADVKRNLFGWDYLEFVFMKIQKDNPELIDPEFLSNCSVKELKERLADVFAKNHSENICTLDRLEERVEQMIEIGKLANKHFNNSIFDLLGQSKGFLLNEDNTGFYEFLPTLKVFSDPQRKKISFLLKLLIDAGLIKIKDPENLIPIMDYHMQRVLLRMGCVEVIDEQLKNDLKARKTLNSDKEIREACIEAMRIISRVSGFDVLKMNDLFWPLGRSCCNEITLCRTGKCEKSPCSLLSTIEFNKHNSCFFEDVCLAGFDDEYLKYWQPVVETHFY